MKLHNRTMVSKALSAAHSMTVRSDYQKILMRHCNNTDCNNTDALIPN